MLNNFKSEIMAKMKELLAKRGTQLPYNVEKGQIQETNGCDEWYTVKFNYSSVRNFSIFNFYEFLKMVVFCDY